MGAEHMRTALDTLLTVWTFVLLLIAFPDEISASDCTVGKTSSLGTASPRSFETIDVVAVPIGAVAAAIILKIAPLIDIPANPFVPMEEAPDFPTKYVSTRLNAGSTTHAAIAGIATE
jgi:hypothetical protein